MKNASKIYETIKKTLACDSPYPVEAMLFIVDTITAELHFRQVMNADTVVHLTADDIIELLAKKLVEEYWFMASVILGSWNIKSSVDIGNIMNALVKARLFSPSKNDSIEDFQKSADIVQLIKKKLPETNDYKIRPDIIIE